MGAVRGWKMDTPARETPVTAVVVVNLACGCVDLQLDASYTPLPIFSDLDRFPGTHDLLRKHRIPLFEPLGLFSTLVWLWLRCWSTPFLPVLAGWLALSRF